MPPCVAGGRALGPLASPVAGPLAPWRHRWPGPCPPAVAGGRAPGALASPVAGPLAPCVTGGRALGPLASPAAGPLAPCVASGRALGRLASPVAGPLPPWRHRWLGPCPPGVTGGRALGPLVSPVEVESPPPLSTGNPLRLRFEIGPEMVSLVVAGHERYHFWSDLKSETERISSRERGRRLDLHR